MSNKKKDRGTVRKEGCEAPWIKEKTKKTKKTDKNEKERKEGK